MSIESTYIQYGVPSAWARHFQFIGISATTFKNTSKKNLTNVYGIDESQIGFVKACLVRQPIEEDVMQRLLENSRFVCCMCKGQKSDAYILHHIVEYSETKDNSYENLAVLCPNDHDLAHRTGIALTNKITQEQIKIAKTNWESQVLEQNANLARKKNDKKGATEWKMVNVFKELHSYGEADSQYFFGRQDEVAELIAMLYKHNIVGLFGESGTGKTSLVNAGLIPQFKDGGVTVLSVRCLDTPIRRIREGVFNVLKSKKVSEVTLNPLVFTENFSSFIAQLKLVLEQEDKRIVIVIDQFEEIFTRADEEERNQLSKGINEALVESIGKSRIYFLFSLREDYIGELWDWSHHNKLEDAWIRQYRIKRLDHDKAFEVITSPLLKLNIKIEDCFVNQLISELKSIGDGLIYPPYLQIVCSALFAEYVDLNSEENPTLIFSQNIFAAKNNVETIIADYLSESMLNGLTEEEKTHAEDILDLLTGPEGLRAFLDLDEISRYLSLRKDDTLHVLDHLIKKKIVHPIVENDIVSGYELVHDFLSKKFFDKLNPEQKKVKTIVEIFRKAFSDWTRHQVLASKDRLEMLYGNIGHLSLNVDEWYFLIKSSFSVYWSYENKWPSLVEEGDIERICLRLINDSEERIVENAISSLGKMKNGNAVLIFKEIIGSVQRTTSIRVTAINQFAFNLYDLRILETLKEIILNSGEPKLRKSAVYAFYRNLKVLSVTDNNIIDKEGNIFYLALNDATTNVRKEAADAIGLLLKSTKSVAPLIDRLKKEVSLVSRKSIVIALRTLLRANKSVKLITEILLEVSNDEEEDYRVREEARLAFVR